MPEPRSSRARLGRWWTRYTLGGREAGELPQNVATAGINGRPGWMALLIWTSFYLRSSVQGSAL